MTLTVTQRIQKAAQDKHGLRLDVVDACELQKLFSDKQTIPPQRCKKAVDKAQKLRLSPAEVLDIADLLKISKTASV